MREDQRVVGDGHPIPNGNEMRKIGLTNHIEADVATPLQLDAVHF